MKKQHVIIYLPNGREIQYSTDQSVVDGDGCINLCEAIAYDKDEVVVREKVDGQIERHSYVNMPYYLSMWD